MDSVSVLWRTAPLTPLNFTPPFLFALGWRSDCAYFFPSQKDFQRRCLCRGPWHYFCTPYDVWPTFTWRFDAIPCHVRRSLLCACYHLTHVPELYLIHAELMTLRCTIPSLLMIMWASLWGKSIRRKLKVFAHADSVLGLDCWNLGAKRWPIRRRFNDLPCFRSGIISVRICILSAFCMISVLLTIYGACGTPFNFASDLEDLESTLARTYDQVPPGSFVVVGYTMTNYDKDGRSNLSTNVQFAIILATE